MNETDVINYYKNTVKRLQQECTEKTGEIIALGQKLHRYKQAIEDIKEIADDRSIYCENCTGGVEDFTCDDCGYVKIIQKCEEVDQ